MDFSGFNLSNNFLSKYQGRQPNWGPLGYVTFKRTYARRLPQGGTEEWVDTLERVVNGTFGVQRNYCKTLNIPWNPQKAQRSAQRMFELMWDMKFLPPGRGLWMMGTKFVEDHGSAALNNCAFCSTQHIRTDFADPFVFLMDMSMMGVGVGGDTRGAGTVTIREPRRTEDVVVIEDSREGWYDAVRVTLDAYAGRGGGIPQWDYSAIRPAGDLIQGFGGVAAGPQPLIDLVETDIPSVLGPLAGKDISSTAIVDLFNFIGKCVVSGNVRRSAEIMLGDPGDEEFLSLKDPVLFGQELSDRRWASNNSLIVDENTDFAALAARTAQNGEPGYFWIKNAQAYGRMADTPNYKDRRVLGCNPCGEQPLEDRELCNLVENFPNRCQNLDEFKEVLKYSYMYAKTVTLIPTHNPKTNAVMLRNRRIGCSLSGIQGLVDRLGMGTFIQWLDQGYATVNYYDKVYSEWLCVPESIKRTSIKPSGTVSLLPGERSGVREYDGEYLKRIIRVSNNSPLIPRLAEAGYLMEPDEYSNNTTCVYFPVHNKDFKRTKLEVTMWEQLELVAILQAHWADNMVSATINFQPHEADSIERALGMFSRRLKSISFLPLDPAKEQEYKQLPFQAIERAEYESMVAQLKPLDLSDAIHEFEDKWCEGGACEIPLRKE